jgi:hypothetical protein
MHLEFGQHSLRMMSCSVLADPKLTGNGLIRATLAQEFGHLGFTPSKPKFLGQAIMAFGALTL